MTSPGVDEQARAEQVVAGMLEQDAFSRWLAVELVRLAPRACTLRLRVRQDMVNGFGVAHGGIAYSLADSAMAFACNGAGTVTVAVDNAISYPAPVHVGDVLVAEAREASASSRLAFYEVTVSNQHQATVALFRGTVYRTQRMHDLPPAAAPSVTTTRRSDA